MGKKKNLVSKQAKSDITSKSIQIKKSYLKNFLKLSATPAVAMLIVITIVFTNLFWVKTTVRLHAQDLMKDINPNTIEITAMDKKNINAMADFSMDLLKQSISKDKNTLISPTSIYLALGMTANGAAGETLKQFETLLGKRTLSLSDLNKNYYALAQKLQNVDSGKMKISNSIWYRDDPILQMNPEFLQINADYFSADAFKVDFASPKTVRDINGWVNNNTNGLIDKVINTIDPSTVMYLLNTVLFDAEWRNVYANENVRSGNFKTIAGTNVAADLMYSTENSFVKDDSAQGFIKPYKGDKFSFVGILPNEGIDLQTYVASLDGTKFQDLINSKVTDNVSAGIPKFKYDFKIDLNEPLKILGLTDGFDSKLADFSNMVSSSGGNLFIGNVLHKTFIQVDELGTKAGAVTKVEIRLGNGAMIVHRIILDRPFLYAIIDNETGLPIFIGTVMNPLH